MAAREIGNDCKLQLQPLNRDIDAIPPLEVGLVSDLAGQASAVSTEQQNMMAYSAKLSSTDLASNLEQQSMIAYSANELTSTELVWNLEQQS